MTEGITGWTIDGKALLRLVAEEKITAEQALGLLAFEIPNLSVTSDEIREVADSLRVVERDDFGDSETFAEEGVWRTRQAAHEAFIAEHDDTVDQFLRRLANPPLRTG